MRGNGAKKNPRSAKMCRGEVGPLAPDPRIGSRVRGKHYGGSAIGTRQRLIWINSQASNEQTVQAGDALPIRRRHMEPGLEAAILLPCVGGLNFERGPANRSMPCP